MQPPAPWTAPKPLPARFETSRLILRFWDHSDAASMLECIAVDRESYLPWLAWIHTDNRSLPECTYTIERFKRARESETPPPDTFAFGIFDRRNGAAVGGTSFHRMDLPSHHAEIGYYIRPDRRGAGLCPEAVRGLITWGFTPQSQGGWGLRRIDIYCSGRNTASQAVPRKLGLRQEVHQPQKRWTPDLGWDDNLGWGVLADEWDVAAQTLKSKPASATE